MSQELSKLINVVITGSRDEVKQAQRDIEQVYHHALDLSGRRDLKQFKVFADRLKDFDEIGDADHQAYFVSTLKWAFMAVGEQHFDEFSQFVLKVIQHPSGKVRQAVIHAGSWLMISASPPLSFEEAKKEDNKLVLKLVDQLCRFIFEVEQLLERYEEPKHRRYKYIQSLPPGVYKSVQKLLTEELLRGPYYQELYEDYLERQGLLPVEKLPSQKESMDPMISLMQMSFMRDVDNLEFQRRKIRRELERLLEKTGSVYTVDDVLRVIDEEDSNNGDVFSEMLNSFSPKEEADLREIIQVLQDAWNFFPHKCLGGKSPVEMVLA